MPRPDALAPLVRTLPTDDADRYRLWSSTELRRGLRLIASHGAIDRARWRHMLAERTMASSATVSRSSSEHYRAVSIAETGRTGLDLETLDRVALNADMADAWIADRERAAVVDAADPVLELACHWVLKEAYGKALRIGLALPLAAIEFHSEDGIIAVTGAAAPMPGEGWWFGLYRRDDRVFGIAHQRDSGSNPVGARREETADTAAR